MSNPPIDNTMGQQYLRLYSLVSSFEYPTIAELDQVIKVVYEDFPIAPPKQPIELPIVVTNGNFTVTNTEI